MPREDDSRVSLREMAHWLVPLIIVIIGLSLFFSLERETRALASPVQFEAGLR